MTKKQMEKFILTDKFHLLREEESFLHYQLKRLWYFIKSLKKETR